MGEQVEPLTLVLLCTWFMAWKYPEKSKSLVAVMTPRERGQGDVHFTLGASQRLAPTPPVDSGCHWGPWSLQGMGSSSVPRSLGFWKHSKETLLSTLSGHTD